MFDVICYTVLFAIVLGCLIPIVPWLPRLLGILTRGLGYLFVAALFGLIVFNITPLGLVLATIVGCTIYLANCLESSDRRG